MGQPAYLYLWDHGYPAADEAGLHAFHASELPYVFRHPGPFDGTPPLLAQGHPTRRRGHALSHAMIDYWTSFARTGRPQAAGAADWPAYAPGGGYTWRSARSPKPTPTLCPVCSRSTARCIARRRAGGELAWNWNVGLVSPVLPGPTPSCPDPDGRGALDWIWCGRPGLEPAQAFRPYGFSYHFGFRRPAPACGVRGLDYPFTMARSSALGAARLVSTPSPGIRGLARDCHLTGFPEFEQFCIPGFPRGHSRSFKSVASTNSATPAKPSRYSRPGLGRRGFRRRATAPRPAKGRGAPAGNDQALREIKMSLLFAVPVLFAAGARRYARAPNRRWPRCGGSARARSARARTSPSTLSGPIGPAHSTAFPRGCVGGRAAQRSMSASPRTAGRRASAPTRLRPDRQAEGVDRGRGHRGRHPRGRGRRRTAGEDPTPSESLATMRRAPDPRGRVEAHRRRRVRCHMAAL